MNRTLALTLAGSLVSLAAAGAITVAGASTEPNYAALRPYDEAADARAQVRDAMAEAKKTGKKTLLVFGANWCGDCKMLDVEMKQGALKSLTDQKLVVAKIDVGRFNKNLDVAEQYDPKILKQGVPSVVLLDPKGNVLQRTVGGELADARKMGRDGITAFFNSMLGKAQ